MKTFEIRVKTVEEALEGFAQTFEALQAGKRVEKKEGTFFTSIEAARNLLTPKRVRLLTIIHKHRPKSIYELAKLCNRDQKNVSEDVKLLEKYGILRTRLHTEGSRTHRVPEVPYDEINVRIPLTVS